MKNENELSAIIIGCCIEIHKSLGPGLLESTYEKALLFELRNKQIRCASQVNLPIRYRDIIIDAGLRLDLLVEDLVIVELKSVEQLQAIHKKQLLTYLKLTNKRLGLLINFNEAALKDGITRIVNGL